MSVINKDLELIELDLLIQAINSFYGWDFSHYKIESLRRCAKRLAIKKNMVTAHPYQPLRVLKGVSQRGFIAHGITC